MNCSKFVTDISRVFYTFLFFYSAEESSVQKQLLIRDKFRSNTRKISRMVAEKGLESLQGKVADVAS